jgi:diadenosine tetraphosphate (Ap4A) HIT family hydrolase
VTLERLWAGWRATYVTGVRDGPTGAHDCLFCALAAAPPEEALVVAGDDLVFVVLNAFPYSSGHLMIAPRRHEADLEALNSDESAALMAMTQRATVALKAAYSPDGLNVGANLGRSAGAGIPGHVHLHALPRWDGDTNFMTSIAEARVLPEDLRTTWQRLRDAWPES